MQLLISLSVVAVEPERIACSKIEISVDDTESQESLPVVFMLGLPVSMTKREFEIFLEPFVVHIEGFCILDERTNYESLRDQGDIYQFKKSAVIFFADGDAVRSFQDLYSNLQLPSYSENAPSVVLHPGRILVDCLAQAELVSASAASPIQSSPSSPQRASSPYKRDSTDLWYQRGIQLLFEHTSISAADCGMRLSPSGKLKGAVNPDTQCALPTCAVCLRRIRCVSTLAAGLDGASDLLVGRSYTSDARLSLDEQSAINTAYAATMIDAKDGGAEERDQLGVRCIVCHIYHTAATTRNTDSTHGHAWSGVHESASSWSHSTASGKGTANLGRCRTCNLSENIWVCLLCGHTGCGRYTSQHAKAHFQDCPSHHLSLELASGRIWNYATDTFAYIEDESAHYITPNYSIPTRTMSTAAGISHSRAPGDMKSSNSEDEDAAALRDYDGQGRESPAFTKKFLLPSFLYPTSGDTSSSSSRRPITQQGRYQGHFAASAGSELLSEESAASLGLDCITTDKINALMGYYERLLETQLLDQQLYFEKLLARETVRALESSYQHSQHGQQSQQVAEKEKESNAIGSKKASKTNVKASATAINDGISAAEEKTERTAPSSAVFSHEAGMNINSPFLTRSNAFAEAQSELENEEVLRDMGEVEQLKLEISAIEADYRGVLEAVRAADDQVRVLKKENDVLIKSQKAKREKEALLLQKADDVRRKCDAQIADMEQQITDLTFYTRARKQVQESPLRDEIKGGTVVTKQQKAPETTANSGNATGNASKKGTGRKS